MSFHTSSFKLYGVQKICILTRLKNFLHANKGQASLEAALLIPVFLSVLGLFIQPAVLLYDHVVISGAASQLCRLVETNTMSDSAVRAYALRRLSAVPYVSVFHNGAKQGWDITWSGGQNQKSTVTISHTVSPLPFFGIIAGMTGHLDSQNHIIQKLSCSATLAPQWVKKLGTSPQTWMERWQ